MGWGVSVVDVQDEDEDIDDTASSYRGDESSPVSPQVTKEPLQGEPPILGTTMKRAGSDGISHQLKKAVQGIKNNFVRAKVLFKASPVQVCAWVRI